MSLLLESPRAAPEKTAALGPAGEVRAQVWSLLAGMYTSVRPNDARRHERFAYPRLIVVTPADEAGEPLPVGTCVAAGRHISEAGLGFYHAQQIPSREVIVSLDHLDGTWRSFLLELRWCRFIRQGWYESGGRLLRTAPTPADSVRWPRSTPGPG